ncbi:MAG: thiamine phosphate synthase [Thermomicrobiales bacterium]|nr:thiamine phosphate synthase [Thermomicrobiales bacterium]
MAFRSLELEQALRVYLVADPSQTPGPITEVVQAALAGGVTMVQLRAKTLHDLGQYAIGRVLLQACRAAGAAFIVNDRLDLALALGADGIHLGVDDLPLEEARRLAPPGFVIGYSPATDEQARRARERGASYLGVGPVFGTASKSDAGDAIGFDVLERRAWLSRLPTIGIGGITPENAPEVIRAGACGVAVIGAISRSPDPEHAARALREAVDGALARPRG